MIEWRSGMEEQTIELLARAFADNPIHRAAFGAGQVVDRNRAFFRVGLSVFRGRRLVAISGSQVLGFVHWVESPGCQLSLAQRVGVFPAMLRGFGLASTLRVGSWLSAWAHRDHRTPHSHFGPIGVDPEAQGQGIGRRLMERYCTELDAAVSDGYLETDDTNNVTFYRKFGFEVVREELVIGTTTFFMARRAASKGRLP